MLALPAEPEPSSSTFSKEGGTLMRILIPAIMLGLALNLPVGQVSASPRPSRGGMKNGDNDYELCVETLVDGEEWVMRQWQEDGASCRFSIPPFGVMVRLDYGEMLITQSEGIITQGIARVYTDGMPFRVIGDQVHLVSSNDIVDLVVEDGLTIILSQEGEASVVSCEQSLDPACVRRGYYLLKGHLLALKSNGALYAWEDEECQDIRPNADGCNASAGNGVPGTPPLITFLCLTAMWLWRRQRKRRTLK